MKVTITRCDRCGEAITGNSGYVALNWKDQETDDLVCNNPYERMDFCEKCMQIIRDCIEAPVMSKELEEQKRGWSIPEFFKEGPEPDPAEEDPEPEAPKPDKKESVQRTKSGKKLSLDMGKVKALRNAGWTLEKIADEFGCCAQTIANALQRDAESAITDALQKEKSK